MSGLQYVAEGRDEDLDDVDDPLGHVVLRLRAQEHQQTFLGQLWGIQHRLRFQFYTRDRPDSLI